MTLRWALSALVDAAPPDATIPVRWIAEQLAADDGVSEPAHGAQDGARADLTAEQVAQMFGRGVSTVRTWCGNGTLPDAYRLHGREWRIPWASVEAMQRVQAAHARPACRQVAPAPTNLGEWRTHIPSRVA